MPINVVLYQPEIPPNTGNIARTCVATNVKLHLIHPLGFDIDVKTARRAGMDYWEHCDVSNYDSLDDFFKQHPNGKFYYIETGGTKLYSDVDYSNIEDDIFFVFGKESTGLPNDLIADNQENILSIPMTMNVRSLNLSNTAAILIYEAMRQQAFKQINEINLGKDYTKE